MPIRKAVDDRQTTPEALLHRRHVVAYEVALEQISDGSKMLEIGHGEGYGTHLLSKKADIIGIDIVPSIVKHAQQKYGESLFRLFDGVNIPFPDNHFDAACMFQVIEHIESDRAILAEICRVLRKAGVLILTTPNRVLRVPFGEKPWNEEHVREYYPEELSAVLQKAGFTSVKLLGIDASDSYREIELRRVSKARKLRKLDPFHLRKLLPDQMLYRMGRVIARAGEEKQGAGQLNEFFVTETDLYRSLDLLAIATK